MPWEPDKQTEHNNDILQGASWNLTSNLKKQHVYTAFTKSFSKNSLNKLFRQIWLFSMSKNSLPTCTATQSSHTNLNELVKNKKS